MKSRLLDDNDGQRTYVLVFDAGDEVKHGFSTLPAFGGGHLLSAIVRPLLEVVVVESPAHLHRVYERTTGMAMISLD